MTKEELKSALKDFGSRGKQVADEIYSKLEEEKETMDTDTRVLGFCCYLYVWHRHRRWSLVFLIGRRRCDKRNFKLFTAFGGQSNDDAWRDGWGDVLFRFWGCWTAIDMARYFCCS